MSTAITSLKRTARLPVLALQLSEQDPVSKVVTPFDLTGASEVRLRVKQLRTGETVIDALMTVDNAAEGLVSYAWAADDTAETGGYELEVHVTFPTALPRIFPDSGRIPFVIEAEIAAAA